MKTTVLLEPRDAHVLKAFVQGIITLRSSAPSDIPEDFRLATLMALERIRDALTMAGVRDA